MDQQEQERINRAAEEFTNALVQSQKVAAETGVNVQEQNAQLTQNFFNSVINNLRTQAEGNRQTTQQLADQQQRAVEAGQQLTQESVNAYMDFVNSTFSFWQGGVQQAQRSAEAAGGSTNEAAQSGSAGEAGDGRSEELRNIVRESVQRSEAGA